MVAYRRSNLEIEELAASGRGTLLKRTIWATDTHREFGGLLVRESPDVVHVHNTLSMISPSIYSACQERGVPVVQTLHNFRLLCPAAHSSVTERFARTAGITVCWGRMARMLPKFTPRDGVDGGYARVAPLEGDMGRMDRPLRCAH